MGPSLHVVAHEQRATPRHRHQVLALVTCLAAACGGTSPSSTDETPENPASDGGRTLEDTRDVVDPPQDVAQVHEARADVAVGDSRARSDSGDGASTVRPPRDGGLTDGTAARPDTSRPSDGDRTEADALERDTAVRDASTRSDAPVEGGMVRDIRVWIAGDSTVATGGTRCPSGWGGQFQSHFDSHVVVHNDAVGGRSVRTWLYEVQDTADSTGECGLARDASGKPTLQARWQNMLDQMRTGDYLLIQFGINDSSATCPRHVGLRAFASTYGMMAQAAKERGAQPIFITPVSSIACNGSTARGTRGSFVTTTQEAGQTYDVPVIDLHALSVKLYQSSKFCPIPGGDISASTGGAVGTFFCDDHTHFDRPGAVEIANLVAQALRDQKLGLANYLR